MIKTPFDSIESMKLSLHSVGIHVSISGKLDQSVDRAVEVGCSGAFQIFTCSPRRWAASPLKSEEVALFCEKVSARKFQVFAHMPYLPNLATSDPEYHEKSVGTLIREIRRCESLGVQYLVVHFGSHMGTSVDKGHAQVIAACKKSIKETEGVKTRLLLENSAGVKNSVGSEFEYVKKVLDGIDNEDRTGVCFDTCHAFSSGYDLRDEKAVRATMKKFTEIIGVKNLYLVHLNDSKGKLGEGKDRHESIGVGEIGLEGFRSFLNYRELAGVPVVLETPIYKEGDDKKNILTVKKLIGA